MPFENPQNCNSIIRLWIIVLSNLLLILIYRITGKNPTELVYADSKTFSGPDEDPKFDANDELIFMARHLGNKLTHFSIEINPVGKKLLESMVELGRFLN